VLVVVAGACRSGPPASACTGTTTTLRQPGSLYLGVDLTYPPFAFQDAHGNNTGLEIDIVRAIADVLKLKVAVVNRTTSVLIPELLAHRYDIAASGLRDSPSLREQACVTSAYMRADLGMLTVAGPKLRFKSAGDIPGHRVAVVQASRASSWMAEHMKGVGVRTYPTEDDLLAGLARGDIDVGVDELAVARFAQKRSAGAFVVNGTIGTGESYVFAVSNDNPGLLARVNDALAKVETRGTLAKIERDWLGG
jgi:ABC-type amino acid transport substrate-binding protein